MQFFKGLPRELEEAASVDGAGPIKTFIKIIIPSSGVIIFTVLIFSIIWHWNDYYLSIMYFNRDYPLAVTLEQYLRTNKTSIYAVLSQMAACLIFVAPMLLFYMVVQRKFIQSIDRVGIVG
jgi:multiple sugar transport system permease protein